MTINNKNKMLIAGCFLMAILCYKLAIIKTLDMGNELENLKIKTKEMQDLPARINLITKQNKAFDSILGLMDMADTSIQNNLLRVINSESKKVGVTVMDFNRPHIQAKGENNLYTFNFNLRGGYSNILQVIHTIEQKGNFGDIVHLDFKKKKNYRTNTYHLDAVVFVQHLK